MTWARSSRHARGYGTAWERLRLEILERDAWLCQCPRCKSLNLVRPANEVDHIVPRARGGTDDPSNLRAVNGACHRRITAEQMGRTVKPRVGLDGFPIEDDTPPGGGS